MSSLSSRLDANKRFDFQSEAFPGGGTAAKFDVIELTGREEISRGFSFEITLVSDDGDVDAKAMLDNIARLNIYTPSDRTKGKPYVGRVELFEQLNSVNNLHFYRAVLAPRISVLSRYRVSEVYVGMKLSAIFDAVIKEENRLTATDYQIALTEDCDRELPFVCQYQESHLDFLSRRMEREGIYHFVTYDGNGRDKWMIVDDVVKLPAAVSSVRYVQDGGSDQTAGDVVLSFICHNRPLSHRVLLQDYNPLDAKLGTLSSEAEIDANGIGDIMLYGEHFADAKEGAFYAGRRAEELRWQGEVFEGSGASVALRCGHFMQLSGHPKASFNAEFLITRVVHEGSQAATLLAGVQNSPYNTVISTFYRNTFSAIRRKERSDPKKSIQFRPQRITPRPAVAGSFSATVEGESADSQYAQIDASGQYRIRLHFGRAKRNAGKASAPVRLSVPYATGAAMGMHFPLLAGAEVLLSFVDGDLDRPYIVNAVANSENTNLVNLANKQLNRIVTPANNSITLDDTRGKEVIKLSSPTDDAITVGGGTGFFSASSSNAVSVGATNKISVGPSTSISASTDTSISASLATKISLGMSLSYSLSQDIKWNSKYSKSLSIDDGDSVSFKDDGKVKSTNSYVISAGQSVDMQARTLAIEAAKSTLGRGIATVAAVNFVLGGTMAGVLGALGEQRSKKNTYAKDTPVNYGTMIGQMTGTAVTTGVGIAVMHKLFQKVAEQYKTLSYASNIKVDGSGIRETYEGTRSFTEVKGSNEGLSFLAMPVAQWMVLNPVVDAPPTYPPLASPVAESNTSSFKLSNAGAATLFTGTKVDVTTAAINLKANSLKFASTTGQAKVEVADAAFTTTIGTASVKMSSQKLKAEITGGGILAINNQGAGMKMGNAAVAVAASGVKLSMGGAALSLKPVSVTLDGSLLKLG
ncbi:hypothetical protein CEJ42_21895 [Herbaspirillum robiniae]|uniref:Uncharacterized protein n=2 Tax=Herbaspirillum robiniae TaxID=2014887 RepID=A0A246WKE1_9BURK|nr:hypothetical protein CEJ42_21895 [Herbaspirillum robiniae]